MRSPCHCRQAVGAPACSRAFKFRAHFLRFAVLAALAACAMVAIAQNHVPGRVIVRMKQGPSRASAQILISSVGAREVDSIPQIETKALQLPSGISPAAFAAELRKTHGVEFAEPDWIVEPAQIVPNDPLYANQSAYMSRISAPNGWALSLGSPTVVAAVLDTGAYGSHPDLMGNLVPGRNVYDDNDDTADLFGHGTNVAGTIAAVGDNGLGIASMTWRCRVMPIRICSSTSSSSSTFYMSKGLTWAADHGARVANISYTGAGSSVVANGAAYLMGKGGVTCMAAGNQGGFLSFPEPSEYLVVGAVNSTDVKEGYSNYGTGLSLVAPGTVYTTTNSGSYGYAAGTSFSSPMAAGLLALMISANPALTPTRLYQLIKQNCDDLGDPGRDDLYGYGRINAEKAIAAAIANTEDRSPPTVAFLLPLNGATVAGTVLVKVDASDTGSGVQSVGLKVNGASLGSLTTAPYEWSWNTGTQVNGDYTLVATATDGSGNVATTSILVHVINIDTSTPKVIVITPTSGTVVPRWMDVDVKAVDDVGITRVDLYIDGVVRATDLTAPFSFRYDTRTLPPGSHVLQTSASDPFGNQGWSQNVTVIKN